MIFLEILLNPGQAASLMGCHRTTVLRQIQCGYIKATSIFNERNQLVYQIPLSALHPEAQLRYFKEHGHPFPLATEKPASAKAYKPLDHFSAAEREEIRQEMETLERWQEYRRQPGRTAELDAEFVELLRQEDPGRAVSVKTLYRKKKALEENDLAGLVDGRGKARKGRSSIDETVWQTFLSFYLDLREPKAKECYEATIQYVRRHYPALADGIPTYSTFVRHIEKDVPYAVQQLGREGKKALRDRCAPYVRRIYDNMESNEIWVADNHTFDVISRDGKTTHRLYYPVPQGVRCRKAGLHLHARAVPKRVLVWRPGRDGILGRPEIHGRIRRAHPYGCRDRCRRGRHRGPRPRV